MINGSKFQLRSLNLDDFAISVKADKLQLVEKAKYLGLWVRNDLRWDDPYSIIEQENVLLCSYVSSSEENPPITIAT